MNALHRFLFLISRSGLRGNELLWRTLGNLSSFPVEGQRVRLPNGFSLRFCKGDWTSFSIYKGQYERATYKFLRQFSKRTRGVSLDIGGNLGSAAFEILKGMDQISDRQIHIFEPFPRLMVDIKQNLDNFKESVSFHELGLCDKELSERNFKSPNLQVHSGLGTFIDEPIKENCSYELLKVTTLDQVVRDYEISEIGLIKIDVEGDELRVLRGARETFATVSPRFIIMEFTPWNYNDDDLDFLHSVFINYRCLLIEEKGTFFKRATLRPISRGQLRALDKQVNLVFERGIEQDS